MRLLFVTSSFARFDGDPTAAAGLGVYQLVRELGKHVSGTVITPAQPGAPEQERLGGMVVRRISPERPAVALHQAKDPRHLMRAYRVDRAMKRAARYIAPLHDVAHGHWAFPGGAAVTRLDIPSVVVCLGTDVHKYSRMPLFRSAFKEVVTRASANIAMDPGGKARIEEVSGREAFFIPNAVPLEDIALGDAPAGKHLAWVGRMSPEKGPDVMIRAFAIAHARDPELTLTMMGDGGEMTAVRALAGSLGVADAIDFRGAVHNNEVLDCYMTSALVVVSSRSEGMPASSLEALATGRPVVATDVGGLRGLLEGGGGLTVPPDDPPALAEAIALALGRRWDPEFLRSQVEHASVAAVAKTYLEIYSQIAGSRGLAGRAPSVAM